MDNTRQHLIDGLREFADFLANHETAPTPGGNPCFDVFCANKEEFQNAARAIGGTMNKEVYPTFMVLRRMFGPIKYDVNISREEVCERIVVGTRIVPEAPAIPAHEEEIVEWKCHPILEA